jgi:putative hemolysin
MTKLLLIGLLFTTVACKKGDGDASAAGAASCDVPAGKECRQYSAATLDAAGEDSLKKLCATATGTFARTPCPTAKLLNICAKREGDTYTYEGSLVADSAEKNCAAEGGTFSKPGAK